VRYAAYRSAEALEAGEREIHASLAPGESAETLAARIIAAATAPRWTTRRSTPNLPARNGRSASRSVT